MVEKITTKQTAISRSADSNQIDDKNQAFIDYLAHHTNPNIRNRQYY